MKYDGLKKLEVTVSENSSVVFCGEKTAAKAKNAEIGANVAEAENAELAKATEIEPHELFENQEITVLQSSHDSTVLQSSRKNQVEKTCLDPTQKPHKKRRFFGMFVKQVVICAAIIGGLVLLKYIDSDFSADLFKGVKDIVSYNFEIPEFAT